MELAASVQGDLGQLLGAKLDAVGGPAIIAVVNPVGVRVAGALPGLELWSELDPIVELKGE